MMKKIFDMENPVMRALSAAADLILLNLLALLCCLPVVTAGASLAALNDIVIRIVRKEEGYIVGPFFRAFRANLKNGVLLTLLLLAAAALLYFDYLAASAYVPMLRPVIAAMGVLVLAISMYAFALTARYENTVLATMKNAVYLAVAYFPRTLGMVAFAAGMWLLALRFLRFGAPVLVMFGLSLPCYVCILLLGGVFKKLES